MNSIVPFVLLMSSLTHCNSLTVSDVLTGAKALLNKVGLNPDNSLRLKIRMSRAD